MISAIGKLASKAVRDKRRKRRKLKKKKGMLKGSIKKRQIRRKRGKFLGKNLDKKGKPKKPPKKKRGGRIFGGPKDGRPSRNRRRLRKGGFISPGKKKRRTGPRKLKTGGFKRHLERKAKL